jgi:2-methylisocitrate lyase-like PEP mutase family enzyme
MRSQAEKGRLFRELHKRPEILILPNPWDAGTAKLLASLGFEALATTSLGMSNALGRIDGEGSVSRAELLENCRVIAQATDLPVNADLENGYADDPREAASILRDAAEVGIVGGSIEDWSGERIYEFNHAVERVAAGAEMARSLPVPFTFVARAENLIRGRLDLDDTIKRLQAFEKAGADVLYAPGLRDLATMRTVVQAVGRPLNVVMSAADPSLTAAEMEAVGVKRLSVGGALSRLALAAFMKGAREMKEKGAFTWVRDAMPTTDLKAVFRASRPRLVRIIRRRQCHELQDLETTRSATSRLGADQWPGRSRSRLGTCQHD